MTQSFMTPVHINARMMVGFGFAYLAASDGYITQSHEDFVMQLNTIFRRYLIVFFKQLYALLFVAMEEDVFVLTSADARQDTSAAITDDV